MTEKKPHPRKLQPPRVVKVSDPIHRQLSFAGIARICQEIEQELRNGRNFEERAEWAATWNEFVRQARKKGNR